MERTFKNIEVKEVLKDGAKVVGVDFSAEEFILIECKGFIIPNAIMRMDKESCSIYNAARDRGFNEHNYNDLKELCISKYYNYTDDDKKEIVSLKVPAKMVQLWLLNEKCDNIIDHHFLDKYLGLGNVPFHFPVEKFRGMKEGDVVDVVYKNIIFRIKLEQLNHRYQRFGKFEEVLNKLEETSDRYWKEKEKNNE